MLRSKAIIMLLVLCMLTLAGCGETSTSKDATESINPKSQTYFVFDTVVTIRVYDKQVTDQHFKEIKAMLDDIENKMSRTIKTSDIYQVNANAGKKAITVSDETFYVVKTAQKYSELSKGRFDVAIGTLVSLWNINHEGAHVPPQSEIDDALKHVDYKNLILDEKNKTIKLAQEGMALDLGGIAKGYAADRIADYLVERKMPNAIIDLSGNIYALGVKPGNNFWTIGIQDPNDSRGNQIGSMRVQNQTVVTSGIYERYFIENGVQYHHILDTKTGYPVVNDLNSVSIVTDHSIDADALSTTLFALGKEEGMKFVENMENTEAIFITKDKKVYMTSGMNDKFHMTNKDYVIVNGK
ncbi:FAD:protein FMN transferase [Paenibacillus sp. GCM10027629]|uniref:FAD:protein FMN transferase n=1 Tax=Paenibacillus sp. GCM10027629 TaxID=3273414 RepID=UPI00363C4B62